MLQSLIKSDTWLREFDLDFRRRFAMLLSRSFRDMPSKVAAALLDHTYGTKESSRIDLITPQDLRRLRSYTSGISDYYGILDITTILAQEYFRYHTWELKLTSVQNIILVAVGLQQKTVKDISKELQAPHSQIMSLFQRCLKQFSDAIYAGEVATVQKQDEEELASHTHANSAARDVGDSTEWDPLAVGMTEELMEAGQQASAQLCAEQKELLDSVLDSAEFDVDQGLEGWKSVKLPKTKGGLVSIKTGKALKKADTGLVEKLAKEEEAARNKKIESGIRKKARKDKAKIKA
jgi:N-acetyltransferase 10